MQNKIEPSVLLRLFLGIVFLSAGLYRMLNWQSSLAEFSRFPFGQLDNYLIIFVIALEIIGGFLLIFNKKNKIVLTVIIIFVALALIQIVAANLPSLLNKSYELFSFDATPTDVFLHFTYLIILVYLLIIIK